MFFPSEMNRITIGLHRDNLQDGIRSFHENGAMEIINIRDSDSRLKGHLSPSTRPEMAEKCVEYKIRIDKVLDAFAVIKKDQKNPFIELFRPSHIPKVPVDPVEPSDIFLKLDAVLEKADKVLSLKSELLEIRDKKDNTALQIDSVTLLLPFDIDLSWVGESKYLFVAAGLLEREYYRLFIQEMNSSGIIDPVILTSGGKDKDPCSVICAFLSADYHIFENCTAATHFREIELDPYMGTPEEALVFLKERFDCLSSRELDIMSSIRTIDAECSLSLLVLREELLILKERIDAIGKAGKTRDVIFIEGWIPSGEKDNLKKGLSKATDDHLIFDSVPSSDSDLTIPVKYDNPRFLQPFQYLTTMFARPKYHEIDPTPFIAPIFVLFFGLMLGDAGYGIVITVVGYLIFRGAGRVSPTMYDLSYILIACGLSAIVFGTIQGGWFGDFFPRFLGITPPLVIIDPLKDPIAFFQIALIIGIIHINLGLCLALYQNLKQKAYKIAIFQQGAWFIIQPSAAVLLDNFFQWGLFPPQALPLAYFGTIAGLIMIFWHYGPMGFFRLTGFLGDWLSYVRILALALATAGIAMTVNILTGLVGSINPFLVVVAVIVFLGGHIFNIIIQSLGGVIHAIRLQYIEFFGKFYVGGGREYEPFMVKRTYTIAREEDR